MRCVESTAAFPSGPGQYASPMGQTPPVAVTVTTCPGRSTRPVITPGTVSPPTVYVDDTVLGPPAPACAAAASAIATMANAAPLSSSSLSPSGSAPRSSRRRSNDRRSRVRTPSPDQGAGATPRSRCRAPRRNRPAGPITECRLERWLPHSPGWVTRRSASTPRRGRASTSIPSSPATLRARSPSGLPSAAT